MICQQSHTIIVIRDSPDKDNICLRVMKSKKGLIMIFKIIKNKLESNKMLYLNNNGISKIQSINFINNKPLKAKKQ
jgi:hypothetical protein